MKNNVETALGKLSNWDANLTKSKFGILLIAFFALFGIGKAAEPAKGRMGNKSDTDSIKVEIQKCSAAFLPQGLSGNSVSITAKVVKGNAPGKFKFTLFEVSSEPGYCGNAPVDNPSNEKDLVFESQPGFAVGATKDIAETTSSNIKEATVVVNCRDFGAYGKIKVEFKKSGTTTYSRKAVESGNSKLEYTRIPLDDNANKIADGTSWDIGPGTKNWSGDDNDPEPIGSGIQGDGFSRYDEYRGFFINGTYMRTSINKKDIFIWDEYNLGTGYFYKLGYEIHANIQPSEMTSTRQINFNHTSGIKPMKAVRLTKDLRAGGTGTASGTVMGGALISIPIEFLQENGGSQALIDNIISHELGHTVFLSQADGNFVTSSHYRHSTPSRERHCAMDTPYDFTYTPASRYCSNTDEGATWNDGCQESHHILPR